MIYTELTKKAMNIAYAAHHGQRDKGGMPYFFHAVHVAEAMEDELTVCAALLHDVLEDTEWTAEMLKREGFPDEVITVVELLTHTEDEDYEAYIRRLSGHPAARRIKQADLLHNSDLSRLDTVGEEDRKRAEKYRNAYRILEKPEK